MELQQSRLPWLVLTEIPNSATRKFFNLVDNNAYEIELPELQGTSCVGSSEGWLVLVNDNLDICLFDPFSRAQIPLPPQPTFECQNLEGYLSSVEYRRDQYITKVCLSSSPSSSADDDCVVLALYGVYRNLAFCRLGSTKWTNIPSNYGPFEDATFFQGNFCAVSIHGTLVVCDLGPEPRVKEIVSGPKNVKDRRKYIVNAYDRLFLVIRTRIIKNDYLVTKGFKVYALMQFSNECGKKPDFKWKKVVNLSSLALFVGGNSSMCLSADDYPGCRRNCIYFADEYVQGFAGDSDMGVFNYGEGTVERPYPVMSQPEVWPPIWIKPNQSIHSFA